MNKDKIENLKFPLYIGILTCMGAVWMMTMLTTLGKNSKFEFVLSIMCIIVGSMVGPILIAHNIGEMIAAAHEPEPVKEAAPISNVRIAEKEAR